MTQTQTKTPNETEKLPNYLRTLRLYTALSQAELAFLVGARSGDVVSRHELFSRAPAFAVALAYVVVFRKPLAEIFTGDCTKVEAAVRARAEALVAKLRAQPPTPKRERKLETLAPLLADAQ